MKKEDLAAVARVHGRSYPVIVPLLFDATPVLPARIRAAGCQFVFIPNQTMTVDYRISPRGQKSVAYLEERSVTWPQDLRAAIRWDGKDRQARPAPDGAYVLFVTATPSQTDEKPSEPLTFDYQFSFKRDVR